MSTNGQVHYRNGKWIASYRTRAGAKISKMCKSEGSANAWLNREEAKGCFVEVPVEQR